MSSDDPSSTKEPTATKEEDKPVILSQFNGHPFLSKVVFPALPPSTLVGDWILTGHSFAPQRDYFMLYCAGLARQRVTDHLMWFKFPHPHSGYSQQVPVHYSRLTWIGGPLAQLLIPPTSSEPPIQSPQDLDYSTGNLSTASNLHLTNVNKMDIRVGTDIDFSLSDDVVLHAPQQLPPKSLPQSSLIDHDPTTEVDRDVYVRDTPVLLSEDTSPRSFAIVVKFLYCEEIRFNFLTFDEIVALANTAHEWGLEDLYNATFSYVMDQDLLAGGLGIRTFVPLVSHPDTPESFRRYFCVAVGRHFDVLFPRLQAYAKTEDSLGPNRNPRPLLWDVIIRQKMLSHVIHCIRLYSPRSYDLYLLDIILRYFEPLEEVEDDEVAGLLSQLNWDCIDLSVVFQHDDMCKTWSNRAVRLVALASYAPHTESLEVRIPWNIPLQRLLKTDIWSFQTEHVPCGPYVCYLHVRKNSGPEVSLFVHVWNQDGTPILDDPRHERVRVTCRATEMNCNCDSRKQSSDSSHVFLENLKFEGRLQRYPGLGWSQFLEAQRLDTWRGCHGEDCGLSITTVLQFLKPQKQFEGPSRRNAGRFSSPTGTLSPIQKKRTGLKMKLRESR